MDSIDRDIEQERVSEEDYAYDAWLDDVESGMYDDDPDPYSGTYSEC